MVPLGTIVRRSGRLHRCSALAFTLFSVLVGVEIEVLDGQIPVGVEDFEAALLFFFVGILVGEELLQERRGVEIIVGDLRVLEDDGGAEIPAAVFGAMVAR